MAHAEHELVFVTGVDGDFGPSLGQGQRFLRENVLPCGDGALDLLGVKRMRRSKDDGLHTGVLEGFRVASIVLEAVGLGKLLSSWTGIRGASNLNIVPSTAAQ